MEPSRALLEPLFPFSTPVLRQWHSDMGRHRIKLSFILMYLVLQFEGFLWHWASHSFNQGYFSKCNFDTNWTKLSSHCQNKCKFRLVTSRLFRVVWFFYWDNQLTLFLSYFCSVLITGDVEKESGINLMTLLLKNLIWLMKPWNMNVLVESTDLKSTINVSRSTEWFTVASYFILMSVAVELSPL